MDTIAGSGVFLIPEAAKERLGQGQTCEHRANKSHAHVLSSTKADFLKAHSDHYGYPESGIDFESMVKLEFSRLNGSVFVDHAGATLFAESQLKAIWDDLAKNLYGNPRIQTNNRNRSRCIGYFFHLFVLAMCNAPATEYKCVFTAGATAALKLVGETFPWSLESYFLYTQENHNSVLGIRQYALDCGSTAVAVDLERSEMPDGHGSLLVENQLPPVAGRDEGSVLAGELQKCSTGRKRRESGDDCEGCRVEISDPVAVKPDGLSVRAEGTTAERPDTGAARGSGGTWRADASRARKDRHADRLEDYAVRSGGPALASGGQEGTNACVREEGQIGTNEWHSSDGNADKEDGEGVDSWKKQCRCNVNGCWTIRQRGLQSRRRKFLSSFAEGGGAAAVARDGTPDSGGVPDVSGCGAAAVRDDGFSDKEAPVWPSQGRLGHLRQRLSSYFGFREVARPPPLHGDENIGRCASENMAASKRESDGLRTSQAVWKGTSGKDEPFHLFAFPAECNFSGHRFDLEIVNEVRAGRVHDLPRGRCMVLVDAAKACGTMPPDLSVHPADFVVVSFYKMFGYPTGLGALLIRNDAAQILRKRYFGGGTVGISIADIDFMKRRETTEEWLEDGTLPFLEIASLQHGYRFLNRLGTAAAISRHTGALTRYAAAELKGLRHGNGEKVCVLYGNHEAYTNYGDCEKQEGGGYAQGPVIAFNVKRSDGSFVGKREVERLAALNRIQLRTGCFCNPGSCAKHLGLTHGDMHSYYNEENVCWDDHDIIRGRPTGAIRISFGYMSTFEDAEVSR
ncbi:hypothetical protein CBR_g6363 [Chara braunii]|uniref:Aminotransferase class V domain-containing protein n=1 Tax=Chara braunii TaxID=69332 RepID=A0A388KJK1_CHABU|nr:hypothetical protein CBR_g6363 [Chara braunii]|eukprot:GBG70232.1 hypothetical protein CBR_g6363 [Chara braunii]